MKTKLLNLWLLTILMFMATLPSNKTLAQDSAAFGKVPEGSVVFLSDSEGDWNRVQSFIDHSGIFYFEDGRYHLKPGYTFVFKGDTVDREISDLRILDFLLGLKEESKTKDPGSVLFEMGNRDVNKLRLLNEVVTLPLAERATKLKYILTKTMAAPNSFEFRRTALKSILKKENVTDDEVTKNFTDMVGPDGLMTRYLLEALLVNHIPKHKILSVHGAITDKNLGYYPKVLPWYLLEKVRARETNLARWAAEMNEAAHHAILDAAQGKPYLEWRWIVDYQRPEEETHTNDASVVYSRYSDSEGRPKFLSKETQALLEENDIETITGGHTPVGESVVLMRGAQRLRVALVDTSYSVRRESAVVWVNKNILSSTIGHNEFGTVKIYDNLDETDFIVGRQTKTGEWIVGTTADNRFLTHSVAKVEGQHVYKNILTPHAADCDFELSDLSP